MQEEEFALSDSCQLTMCREVSSVAPPPVVAKPVSYKISLLPTIQLLNVLCPK